MCSHRWGQMGASSRVCTSMNWNTRSLCIPSIASSRYLSLAAWNNSTAISPLLPGRNTQSHTHTHLWALTRLQNVSSHIPLLSSKNCIFLKHPRVNLPVGHWIFALMWYFKKLFIGTNIKDKNIHSCVSGAVIPNNLHTDTNKD